MLEKNIDDSTSTGLDIETKSKPLDIFSNMQWYNEMVDIIKNKTGDEAMDDHFYQTLVNNKLSQVASSLRIRFENYDGGVIMANFYSFLLAISGCVDKDTEYLSIYGWRKISDYKGEPILSWNEDGTSEFMYPDRYIKGKRKSMRRYISKNTDMVLSEEHNMALINKYDGKFKKIKEKDFYSEPTIHRNFSVPFNFSAPERSSMGVPLTDDELRLQVMFNAYGSIQKNGSVKHVGKSNLKHKYKIDRLLYLLDKTGTEYKVQYAKDGYARFRFTPPMLTKNYHEWAWACNDSQLKVIYDESYKWDGTLTKQGNKLFRTTIKEDADFMQYVFRTQSDLVVNLTKKERHDKTPFHTEYIVRETTYRSIGAKTKIENFETEDGFEYCFTMPNENWIARRNGKIFLTKNSGKGRANSMLKKLFFKEFDQEFLSLFASRSKASIEYLGELKARREGMEVSLATSMIQRRFNELPKFIPAYNDATEAGLKTLREKLTLASVGSTNVELDELGINMNKIEEFLSAILEVYDNGELNQKLTKTDSSEDTNAIPATFLAFGTGSTLLDGSAKEEKFMEFLRQGLSRRCSFSYSEKISVSKSEGKEFDPFEVLSRAKSAKDTSSSRKISTMLFNLCKSENIDKVIKVPNTIWAQLLTYENECKIEAAKMSEFDDILRLNLVHSYWQLSKLMTIYAFIDGKDTVEQIHYDTALNYLKESFKQLKMITKTKTNGERIAEFICMSGTELTLFDLTDKLPFYKSGNKQQKQEMLDLAQSFAATHDMVIKHILRDGIDYYSGTRLEQTKLTNIRISIGAGHPAEGFVARNGAWEDLYQVPTMKCNYSAHWFRDSYRKACNAIPGFDLVILDIDDGVDILTAKAILDGQKYMIATTKSHQKEKRGKIHDRYRIFLPMKYNLEMEEEEYSQFMANIMEDFPIECDPSCKDISRFYYGCDTAEYWYGEGELFDPARYIPNTEVNKKRVIENENLSEIGALERYFLKRMSPGNRNNMFQRFAFALADSGESYENIEDRVHNMNRMLEQSLPLKELSSTVLKSVRKKIYG